MAGRPVAPKPVPQVEDLIAIISEDPETWYAYLQSTEQHITALEQTITRQDGIIEYQRSSPYRSLQESARLQQLLSTATPPATGCSGRGTGGRLGRRMRSPGNPVAQGNR